jgi:hypothetical protein
VGQGKPVREVLEYLGNLIYKVAQPDGHKRDLDSRIWIVEYCVCAWLHPMEPELEPQGAGTFGRSRSWSRYTEVSALVPAPGSGSRSN